MVELSKKLTTNIGRTNAEYGLIKEGDKILIGFSGGKDSTFQTYFITKELGYNPLVINFHPFDQDFKNY